jgi:hypothetical protein
LDIKPSRLIIIILAGYLAGVLLLFFDNTNQASFSKSFSHFSAVDAQKEKFTEPVNL